MLELVARRFRALGEMQRLRIIQVLEQGEKSVGEIVAAAAGSQSNISRHLQALYDAGLVSRRRDGNSVLYEIADPIVLELCALVCKRTEKHIMQRLPNVALQTRSSLKARQ
ncbi:MAG TPA: metalloregulator ArsR/SmtB family transcription factor [Acidobacteriaceae bacterium]|nr:metalloregulator ArsR/SmtB family transcription factor [Acidobacteriaceae bacterium]